MVFHGHSVPSGYRQTPLVKTFTAYPHLVVRSLSKRYDKAMINSIVTAYPSENSSSGLKRFARDVLSKQPDIIFVDYGVNDFAIGVDKSISNINEMVKLASIQSVPIVLVGPFMDIQTFEQYEGRTISLFTRKYMQYAQENNIIFINSYKLYRQSCYKPENLYICMSSPAHPNDRGHQLISDEILRQFSTINSLLHSPFIESSF
ncbi:SGNH/GDSL hydrolase family protein [Vibrio coralliilyticus]|uniref:SGNH/GDSL hydrolase family protein n=1 Tax=Vibrio TaxID=662 RepID=UPI0009E014A4|nr:MULTISPECIES: SGNH/GDSL hydrolase family protein [Vibrio]NOI18059.1 SGNH/GDSL hydrolase family protein [Vibrio coralliilyticus]